MGEDNKNNSLMIPGAIIIAGLIIAGALYYRPGNDTQPFALTKDNQIIDKASWQNMRPVSKDDRLLGNPAAPIKIVEYSDLECPYCKVFHLALNKILSKYVDSGQIAVIYRHFPLNIHPQATPEAEAAECVANIGGNDAFWKYVDKIFQVTPSNNKLDPGLLPQLAAAIGIDQTKFNDCIAKGEGKDRVAKDIADGEAIGVNGTPFVMVIDSQGNKYLPLVEKLSANVDPKIKAFADDLEQAWRQTIDELTKAAAVSTSTPKTNQ